jgi:ribosomal protein L30/L7E
MATLRPLDPSLPIKNLTAVLETRDRNIQALSLRAQKVKSIKRALKEAKKPFHVDSLEKIGKARKQKLNDQKAKIISAVKKTHLKVKKQLKTKTPSFASVSAAQLPVVLVIRNDKKPGEKNADIIKMLSDIRLTSSNHGRFFLNTDALLETLVKLNEYVFYGVPSKATVDDLLHKKAYYRLSSESEDKKTPAKPLNDNKLIEDLFGDQDILCIEDIQAVIETADKNAETFDKINNLLTPFHFRNYRAAFGETLKSGKAIKGRVNNIDKIVKKIA